MSHRVCEKCYGMKLRRSWQNQLLRENLSQKFSLAIAQAVDSNLGGRSEGLKVEEAIEGTDRANERIEVIDGLKSLVYSPDRPNRILPVSGELACPEALSHIAR